MLVLLERDNSWVNSVISLTRYAVVCSNVVVHNSDHNCVMVAIVDYYSMLPRQHLDLVPCEASGWVVQSKRSAHELAISSPGSCTIASIHTLGFHSRIPRAEHWRALKFERAHSKIAATVVLWPMFKHKFLYGLKRRSRHESSGV